MAIDGGGEANLFKRRECSGPLNNSLTHQVNGLSVGARLQQQHNGVVPLFSACVVQSSVPPLCHGTRVSIRGCNELTNLSQDTLSLRDTQTPRRRRTLTTSVWPFSTAACRGVMAS